ncbi:MAG: hypothetical protein FJX72_15775, partial [Armatimonadetes bacterium]|nr:hypothetical protein [Armatimonadota bacterium]
MGSERCTRRCRPPRRSRVWTSSFGLRQPRPRSIRLSELVQTVAVLRGTPRSDPPIERSVRSRGTGGLLPADPTSRPVQRSRQVHEPPLSSPAGDRHALDASQLRWADVPAAVLNIPLTLNSGQVFRWRREPDGLWWGTVEDTLVALRPAQDGFGWATWPSDRWPVISRFLSLETDLPALYRDWAAADPSFGALIGAFRGLRVLRQSADAALVSFVCSSCNNVPRIACMVTSLAELIGDRIENPWGLDARTDPSVEDLANITED